MKNPILVLLMIVIWAISGCTPSYRYNPLQSELKAERKAERKAAKLSEQKAAKQSAETSKEYKKVAGNCDTPPSGSYRDSCRSCQSKTTDECTDLTCECQGKDNQWHWSIVSKLSCPQNRYCNNDGVLQCGDC